MIKQLDATQIASLYPNLYSSCFDHDPPKRLPTIVLVGYNATNIYGFSSGYAFNDDIFYINATGLIKEYRTKKSAVKLAKRVDKLYKDMGFKKIMAHIDNNNNRAIITAMLSGYKITGTITNDDGRIFVVVIKEL